MRESQRESQREREGERESERERACVHVCMCWCMCVVFKPRSQPQEQDLHVILWMILGHGPEPCSVVQPSCPGGASPSMQFFKRVPWPCFVLLELSVGHHWDFGPTLRVGERPYLTITFQRSSSPSCLPPPCPHRPFPHTVSGNQ